MAKSKYQKWLELDGLTKIEAWARANQLGGWDAALGLLIGMMAVDYLTGILVAAFWQNSNKSERGSLSSKAGFRGLCKKGVILLAVWIGTLLDSATGATYIRTAIVLFYIGNEGISLIENFGLMGVPYPPAMKKALEALREKGEKTEWDITNPQPRSKIQSWGFCF